MILNAQQWKLVSQVAIAASGPIAKILETKYGFAPADVQSYFDLIAALTPLIGLGWGVASLTQSSQVTAVASMPPEAQKQALSNTSDATKVLIAKAVPDVATVVVKDDANGALAELASSEAQLNIVTETQNEADAKLGTKTNGGS